MSGPKFSPRQQKLVDILKDGKPHRRRELLKVFENEPTANNWRQAMHKLRKKLKPWRVTILCVYRNKTFYWQMVRLIGHD